MNKLLHRKRTELHILLPLLLIVLLVCYYFIPTTLVFVGLMLNAIGILVVGIFLSDSKEKDLNDAMWMATHDDLTKIPNRVLFNDRLQVAYDHSVRSAEPFAVAFLDLDDFKPINDKYNHKCGDDILKQVAVRLVDATRTADTVSRYGGDEFAIILIDVKTSAGAITVAKKLISIFDRPFYLTDYPTIPIYMKGSLGVTFVADNDTKVEDILGSADKAMYVAKNGKLPVCIVTPDGNNITRENK